MPSGQPTLYIAQADVLRAERVLRAVERALARAVEYQETTGAEHETPEAEAEAEGVVRAARAGFEERWARSSGYNRLQAELELAREQLLAARHRLNAMTSGHQPPRGGPGEPVSTEPVAVRTTAVRASPRVPVADEPRPDGLGESAAEPPGENLDVVPSGPPSGDEDSVEEPRAAVPQQAAGSDGRPALLLARTPLGEPRIEARVCPVCLKEGLVEGRTRHQRCEGRSLAQESADPPPPAHPQHADHALYRALVRSVEAVDESGPSRTEQTVQRLKRRPAAREAVLVRSGGHCENPGCAGQPSDLTDSGQPILEVDHIVELAAGGRDHPEQMVALCPNCHAVKTRGRSRESLRSVLLDVAARRHKDLTREDAPQA